jgi:hypothetical protein
MLGSRAATKRFLEVIGNVCPYENAFAISHLSTPSLRVVRTNPANTEQVYKPNSVLRSEIEAAIIHLVQPLPAGSSDLPGGRSLEIRRSQRLRAGSPVDASLFGLALRGVCLAAHVAIRAGALLPHHFTHYLLESKGWFAFCCTCRRPSVRRRSNAPPLAGSPPCSVRTFLSRLSPAATARPVLLQGERIIANECSTGIARAQRSYPKYLNPTRKLFTHCVGKKSATVMDASACEIASAKRFGIF